MKAISDYSLIKKDSALYLMVRGNILADIFQRR